ncbi:hypothetical protein HFU84_01820 [Acidithiobacillus sp. CV18-2]|nr:hypothetical protein [Acidithiobacillus sp. CV18-3]MBU2758603.1 hypothetical protein [Acidithiobacillus sp. BN09-2]MBU2776273.1 hypothetical protein [Acidithiobacillus sp. CV18-2]MBU2800572.1 hypothetical protein [Acidithiobacillus sp. VAN18-4]
MSFMDTREIVSLLADISEQVSTLIGEKGGVSVFRYAGRQMGRRMGAGHHGTIEDARAIIAEFFIEKDFMESIRIEEQCVMLSGCKIGLVLQERGTAAGKHALCHFGFGLIDGVTEAVTGQKITTMHVQSEYHVEGIHCTETW